MGKKVEPKKKYAPPARPDPKESGKTTVTYKRSKGKPEAHNEKTKQSKQKRQMETTEIVVHKEISTTHGVHDAPIAKKPRSKHNSVHITGQPRPIRVVLPSENEAPTASKQRSDKRKPTKRSRIEQQEATEEDEEEGVIGEITKHSEADE